MDRSTFKMPYVIRKRFRFPGMESYSGPTWDTAQIRDQYQDQYECYITAKSLAEKLSEHNPVGFEVAYVKRS